MAAARRHLRHILQAGGSPHARRSAALLIGEFATLHAVLAAPSPQIRRVIRDDAAGRHAIAQFRSAMLHALREPVVAGSVIDDWTALTRYLRSDMGLARIEHARVLFLDTRLRLLRDETMWTGTVDQVMFHAREVIGRAIEVGAAGLILIHNHPSGSTLPSTSDVKLTRDVREVAKKLGIDVIDHLVVAGHEVVSMRSSGLM